MEVGKYKKWSKTEDKALKEIFNSVKFKGRWEGGTHYKIKKLLEKRGINRSVKGVSRRLNRLNLRFFKVDDKDILIKCIDCKKPFFVSGRYLKIKNKVRYCKDCYKKHKHDWDKKHRKEVLEYQKEYYRLNKNKIGKKKK